MSMMLPIAPRYAGGLHCDQIPASTRKSTVFLVRLLTFSNFIIFPFLPFPACFFLHLSGSGKKQDGTVKGTERRPKGWQGVSESAVSAKRSWG
jgi:hypothetical protein